VTVAYAATRRFAAAWLSRTTAIAVRGVHHVPREGGAILVANHPTPLDGLALMTIVPRPMHGLMKRSGFEGLIANWYLRGIGLVPADPRRDNYDAFTAMERVLSTGRLVLLFPEGDVRAAPGVGPFQGGFLLLASRMGAPVIPAAVRWSHDPWAARPDVGPLRYLLRPPRGLAVTFLGPRWYPADAIARGRLRGGLESVRAAVAGELRARGDMRAGPSGEWT
jgi:1-acyl-sn-glycerol-3-phosphate acyltransferase